MKSYAQRKREERKRILIEMRRQIQTQQSCGVFHEDCTRDDVNNHASMCPDLNGFRDCRVIPENHLFCDILGKEILLIMTSDQLNILGQTFRPIFTGKVVEVTNGYITLSPVIIKMNNAQFYKFPTPLSFPIERITYFTPFDMDTRIPIP